MHTKPYDDLTIERWRIEPRLPTLQFGDVEEQEQAPPLWKDVTLASVVAIVLWLTAVMAFG